MATVLLESSATSRKRAAEDESPASLSQQENIPPPAKKQKKVNRKGVQTKKSHDFTCIACRINHYKCDGTVDKPCTKCAASALRLSRPVDCKIWVQVKRGPKTIGTGPKRIRAHHKAAELRELAAAAAAALRSAIADSPISNSSSSSSSSIDMKHIHVSPEVAAAAIAAVALAQEKAAAETNVLKENEAKANAAGLAELSQRLPPIVVTEAMLSNEFTMQIGSMSPLAYDLEDTVDAKSIDSSDQQQQQQQFTAAYDSSICTPLTAASALRPEIVNTIQSMQLEAAVTTAAANSTMARFDSSIRSSSVEIGSLSSSPLKPPQQQQSLSSPFKPLQMLMTTTFSNDDVYAPGSPSMHYRQSNG